MSRRQWWIRDHVSGDYRTLWLFEKQTATRIGVSNPPTYKAQPGQGFLACMAAIFPPPLPDTTEGQFFRAELAPGTYYPRIARPIANAVRDDLYSPLFHTEATYVADSRSQLTVFAQRLTSICQTVQPTPKMLSAYGHEIRNLLILAATEAEMHCRGILRANGVMTDRLTTNDYVKLRKPLKLENYSVQFRDFPGLPPFSPFRSWKENNPTRSLRWYDAYNAVKHNREHEFERGTLESAMDAVAACLVLFVGQYGPAAQNQTLSHFCKISGPEWLPGEMYNSPITPEGWLPTLYPRLAKPKS